MNNQEWCEVFGFKGHDDFTGPPLNFLSPDDKEFGVMMDWCLEKDFCVELFKSDYNKVGEIGCEIRGYKEDIEIFETAPTKVLAFLGAIGVYLEEGGK